MIVGLTISQFTLLHVIISLVAIVAGFVVLFRLIAGTDVPALTYVFLSTTAVTSISGFLFPFNGVTPAVVFGVLSLVLLGWALGGYLGSRVAGWRIVYVIAATIALYLNVFVLVVQSFQKIPPLHALAPTQSEPAFGIAQLLALAAFVALGWRAVPRSRMAFEGKHSKTKSPKWARNMSHV
jgi:hypothetical protein